MEGFIYLGLWMMVYFIPYIIAKSKKRANTQAIFWVNALLGFTVIGWLVALFWALTNTVSEEQKAAIMARAMADEMQRREAVK
jgi:lipid-A-disaccharide synthase-like uncharacterized protein